MNAAPLPLSVRREAIRLGARTLEAELLANGALVFPTERLAAFAGMAPGELSEGTRSGVGLSR